MPEAVTRYVSGIPMDRCPWYEDPHSIASLYEWLAERGYAEVGQFRVVRDHDDLHV